MKFQLNGISVYPPITKNRTPSTTKRCTGYEDSADWFRCCRGKMEPLQKKCVEIRLEIGNDESMKATSISHCLIHQLPETGTSPIGGVCPRCKRLLYTQPASLENRAYWESQPGAYTLDRQPIFIYTRFGDNYKIRSLIEE